MTAPHHEYTELQWATASVESYFVERRAAPAEFALRVRCAAGPSNWFRSLAELVTHYHAHPLALDGTRLRRPYIREHHAPHQSPHTRPSHEPKPGPWQRMQRPGAPPRPGGGERRPRQAAAPTHATAEPAQAQRCVRFSLTDCPRRKAPVRAAAGRFSSG